MSHDREAMFKQMVAQFPDSQMGHFSLGRYYLEVKRYAEATTSLAEAVRLDPEYAAAWLALADAQASSGDVEGAKATYAKALQTKHGQRDASFQDDIEARLRDLE